MKLILNKTKYQIYIKNVPGEEINYEALEINNVGLFYFKAICYTFFVKENSTLLRLQCFHKR